jgi:hypothetical protein
VYNEGGTAEAKQVIELSETTSSLADIINNIKQHTAEI